MMKIINNYTLSIIKVFLNNLDEQLHLREIERLTNIDIKILHREINHLLDESIIDYVQKGRMKLYYLMNNTNSWLFLQATEIAKAYLFLEKNKVLTIPITKLSEITDFLIFGSYATETNKNSSDLDMIIFSKKNSRIGNILRQLPISTHIHYIKFEEFANLIEKNNPLATETIKHHILFGKYKEISNIIVRWIDSNGVLNKKRVLN